MSAAAGTPVRGPVRHLRPPATPRAWLRRHRFTLARHVMQLGVLLLFYGSLHAGWTLLGRPLLVGNLSAAELLGTLPLADPFAVLQMLVARHALAAEVLVGAAITLTVYALLGGRVFCAWVCPMNLVTGAATALRGLLGVDDRRDLLRLPRQTRLGLLVLALGISAITGLAAFEPFSPIALLHRELLYGAGWGLAAALGVLLLDTLVLRHGWCGHLCPLGVFWSLTGRAAQLVVAFDDGRCTRCGDCVKTCPEPRVLHFAEISTRGAVTSGDCTRCGRCVAICPEACLGFGLRARITAAPAVDPSLPVPGGPS